MVNLFDYVSLEIRDPEKEFICTFRTEQNLSISLSILSYSIAALYYTVEIARENSVLLSRSRRSHHPAVEIYQRPAVVVHTGRIFTNFQEALLTVC
jgi:hypothetical protein